MESDPSRRELRWTRDRSTWRHGPRRVRDGAIPNREHPGHRSGHERDLERPLLHGGCVHDGELLQLRIRRPGREWELRAVGDPLLAVHRRRGHLVDPGDPFIAGRERSALGDRRSSEWERGGRLLHHRVRSIQPPHGRRCRCLDKPGSVLQPSPDHKRVQ